MISKPRIVLHAGLHKTGTTALQSFLYHANEELWRHGFIYPRSGALKWLGGGHHNIAWQLAGDRRYNSSYGMIDDAAHEIAASKLSAIISAEDFESILDTPEGFAPLHEHPLLSGYEFVLLIYVREQASYLESLYLEMLHHGVAAGFAEFAEPLFSSSRITFQDWKFQFDYAELYERFVTNRKMQVVVRNYHQLDGGSVIKDLLGQFCPGMAENAAREPEKTNPRDEIADSLRMLFSNRHGYSPSQSEMETIQRISNYIGTRSVTLSDDWRLKLASHFFASNQVLCAKTGMDFTASIAQIPIDPNGIALEKLFDATTQDTLLGAGADLDDRRLQTILCSQD